jgi:DNA-binding NarL/FixJ family response regulator
MLVDLGVVSADTHHTHRRREDQPRRALVVDELRWWTEGVHVVLRNLDIDVVRELTTPTEALAVLDEVRPDILVTSIDSAPPEPSLKSYLTKVFEAVPALRVVVVSHREDRRHVKAALDAGAAAYVMRRAHPGDFTTAIRNLFYPSVYLAEPRKDAAHWVDVRPLVQPGLTRSELAVLRFAARGYSNAETGRKLWVTVPTVKFHLSNIYRKLGVSNRVEASRWAHDHALDLDLGVGD